MRSLTFMINKNHLSKNMSPLKLIDNSFETSEIFIKWLEDESLTEEFLMLCYIKDNSLKSGKIVLENKCNSEKHYSKEFKFSEIFSFQSEIIDSVVAMISKQRENKS